MSVTFFAPVTPEFWIIKCSCGAANAVTNYATYQDAVDARALGVAPSCGDDFCAMYPNYISADSVNPSPEVNLSNQNARHILSMLAIDFEDGSGSCDAADFMGRILIAQAVAPLDAGVPSTQQGNVVDMGRPAGYSDSRLIEIEEVARYAVENNLVVSWS